MSDDLLRRLYEASREGRFGFDAGALLSAEAAARIRDLEAQVAALTPPPEFEEGAAIGYAQAVEETRRLKAQLATVRNATLEEAADSLFECSVWCDSQELTDDGWHNGVNDARKYHMQRIRNLKETQP